MSESFGSLAFWEREHRRRAGLGCTTTDTEAERIEEQGAARSHGGAGCDSLARCVTAPKKRKERRAQESEWYGKPSEIIDILDLFLKESSKHDPLLHLGCGVSRLPEALWKQGRTNQTCIDFSGPAVEHVKLRDAHLHGVQFLCMDCTDLSAFPDASFEYVVDKGFLDAIFSSLGGVRKVARVLAEISRVLRPGGVYVSISSAPRHCRLPHMMRPEFEWSIDTVGVPIDPGFTAYACQKRSFHLEWFFPDPGALQRAKEAASHYRPPFR